MNLNHLVVSIFALAAMDRRETGTSDLGVAAAKIRSNIRHGRGVDPVDGIPALYMPDWAALHNWEKSVGEDAFAQAWTAMNDRRQALYADLCKLWEAKDYDGMVRIMDDYIPAPLKDNTSAE